MHLNDVVVTLADSQNKTLREYDANKNENGRKCKVFIPFDSQYKIYVKNPSDRRLKLEIEIDGSIVSGNGIIVSAYDTGSYIERFLDTNKCFKFVKASNEAVADPTNRENGIIKVRVSKEKKPEVLKTIIEEHYHYDWLTKNPWYPGHPYWPTYYGGPYWPTYYGGSFGGPIYSTNPNGIYSAYNSPMSQNQIQGSLNQPIMTNSMMPGNEIGATVEGSLSSQTFSSTTWNGDDLEAGISNFTFILFGKDLQNDEEYKKFLELKKKFEG